MELKVGQVETFTRTFTQEDFNSFAELSKDDNPIHVDVEFAASTRFGGTLAHGMFLYSNICRLLGTRLPGPGTLQITQQLKFSAPTFTNQEVTVRVEVLDIQPEKQIVQLDTKVILPDGNYGCEGNTLVYLSGWNKGFSEVEDELPPAIESEAQILKHVKVGQKASVSRVFTKADLEEYASLTGDTNPIFTNHEYARRAGFQGSIIPGPLLSGMFSMLLGTKLPGRGTNWLKQNLRFLAPAYVGEKITATVEVVRLRPEKDLVNLWDTCVTSTGKVVCRAESLVLAKEMETQV